MGIECNIEYDCSCDSCGTSLDEGDRVYCEKCYSGMDKDDMFFIGGGIARLGKDIFISNLGNMEYEMPEVNNDKHFVINTDSFVEIIKKVAFCASNDDSRPILKGMLLEVVNDTLTGVTLDGYRLAKVSNKVLEHSGKMSCVVPAESLVAILPFLREGEDISVVVDDTHMLIKTGVNDIVIKLLQGEFVNYRQVIPERTTRRVVFDKATLTNIVDRLKLLLRGSEQTTIRIQVDGTTTLTALDKISMSMKTEFSGEKIEIGLRAKYLSDVLQKIDTDKVVMTLDEAQYPVILQPLVEVPNELYLILPVRLHD